MKYTLDGAYRTALTAKDRNFLIRYLVAVGTRAKCATTALKHSLRMSDLKKAFGEQRENCLKSIAQHEREIESYDPEKTRLSESMLAFFGGVPSKETFTAYYKRLIGQEKENLRSLKRSYSVDVDYEFTGRKLLAFHRSLSPRVTFGYSNRLHEECDFMLDDEKRAAFLEESTLKDPPHDRSRYFLDWGQLSFGENNDLFYEDLAIFRGETCVLETISHEEMMTVRLEEDDLEALAAQRGGAAVVKKLRACAETYE